MAGERWTFTKSQLVNTPSRKCGVDIDKELSYRQQAANLIQDMGQRLQTNQLCINTAIVYMHRFYMFHSFTKFNRNVMSPACLFLAAKVEEQPRKLEHVIKTSHTCLREGSLDTKSEAYLEHAQELIINENILLQSLGFEVRVDHPHTTVVTTCQLVRASKDLAQTSYFLATNSLHLTTMCLQQKPNVVACVCIHLACKWSGYEIPSSHEGKSWFSYVDKNVTMELLEELTQDFLNILDKCPSRLKKKIMTWRSGKGTTEDDKLVKTDGSSSSKAGETSKNVKPESSHSRNLFEDSQTIISETSSADNRSQQSGANTSSRLADVKSAPQPSHASMNTKDYKQHKEYKERKEKDRLVGHAASTSSSGNKSHGNGDVKRSQNQYSRVDSDRKATQSVYDGIHHISREDPNKQPDLNVKRQHDSPLKMTIKSNRDDKGPKSNEASLSKATKRSHQSDNEMSDCNDRSSKHRRSETHPIVSDNSFSTGTINHSDLFGGQTSYMGIPPPMSKIDTGNGSSGSDRHSKTKIAYGDGSLTSGVNSDKSLWSNVKSSVQSPVNQHVKTSLGSSSRKDRSIFSPLQPPSSHHPPPPPPRHLIQGQSVQRNITQTGAHILAKSSQGNINATFDQSYQHGSHPAVYPQYAQSMMPNAYQDNAAVTGMNSNGGSLQNPNLNQELMGDTLVQLQHLITHQKYQIAATQQAQQIHTNHQPPMSSHQPSMSSIFDIDLLDTDLGVMPPLPPPLPQSDAPQPPPPPF